MRIVVVILGLVFSASATAQGVQAGGIERLPSQTACHTYLAALPAKRVRMAWLNGHQTQTVSDHGHLWRVDMNDAAKWCRPGVNRVRVDLWLD